MREYTFFIGASGPRAVAVVTDGTRSRQLPTCTGASVHDAVVACIRACLATPLRDPAAPRTVVTNLTPARQAVARDYPLELGRTLLRAPTPEEADHIAHVKTLAGGSL